METVLGEELLREILVKLPSSDAARSCCVCRLWRIVVSDPAFRILHGRAAQVVSGAAETLCITESRDDFKGLEMIVVNSCLAKILCRVSDLPIVYGPSNACNGFVLFASGLQGEPLYVCNPITSEKLKITPPPAIGSRLDRCWYAMVFSPSTCQYKLFRLSFPAGIGILFVYTLGAGCNGAGWRRSPYTLPRFAMYSTPPVLVDGKLYLVVATENNGVPDRILVIDTASEAHCMYRLPKSFMVPVDDVGEEKVHTFELSGRLCVALHVPSGKWLRFWVLPSISLQGRQLDEGDMNNGKRLRGWERRYTFTVNDADVDDDVGDKSSGVWLNHGDGMLCYRLGDCLYKYDTAKKREAGTRFLGLGPTNPATRDIF